MLLFQSVFFLMGIAAVVFTVYSIYDGIMNYFAIRNLLPLLFPVDAVDRDEVIAKMHKITKRCYNDDELLDYYLKLKGLHVLDMHADGGWFARRYMMKPTKIRLTYMETVMFYQEFFSFPDDEYGIPADKPWPENVPVRRKKV